MKYMSAVKVCFVIKRAITISDVFLVRVCFFCLVLQRLRQSSTHGRTQEDEDRQRGHDGQRRELLDHPTSKSNRDAHTAVCTFMWTLVSGGH